MKYKSQINFIIDALMFLVMMAIGGIGFLMKYRLIPGSERWEVYGENVELYFWGMDRHQWGSIHLILGFVLFGLLLLHIILHWKITKIYYRLLITNRRIRVFSLVLFLFVSLLFLFFAFFVTFDVVPSREGRGRHQQHRIELSRPGGEGPGIQQSVKDTLKNVPGKSAHQEATHEPKRTIEVRGNMTLQEIEEKYNINLRTLKEQFGIPLNTSNNERLGRLRRRVGFHMSDVERFIEQVHQKEK